MATLSANLGTKSALTITLASLASSSTFVAGRESDQVDNTSNLYLDALLEGFITVGTSPTIGQVLVYVWGSNDSLGTTAKDVLDGTDSAETLSSAAVGYGFLKLAKSLNVDSTTSNVSYDFGVESVANILGVTILPKYWGVFVTHNTVAALNATGGNHEISFSGVKNTIA
jgi:hypothetical protein